MRMRKKSTERKRERRNIYLALTIRKRMNEPSMAGPISRFNSPFQCSMAGFIQRFSTRISIVHGMGVYDVKSATVFGMPAVESDKHRGRHDGMMNVGQNSQRSFDAQPCEEATTRLKGGRWSGGFIGFGAWYFAGRKRQDIMVRDMWPSAC